MHRWCHPKMPQNVRRPVSWSITKKTSVSKELGKLLRIHCEQVLIKAVQEGLTPRVSGNHHINHNVCLMNKKTVQEMDDAESTRRYNIQIFYVAQHLLMYACNSSGQTVLTQIWMIFRTHFFPAAPLLLARHLLTTMQKIAVINLYNPEDQRQRIC
jgi:hypothetical protein